MTPHDPSADVAHRRLAPWPYAVLDVPALRAAGHRPAPFRQFVLKVNSRCNLACSYCYVYEMADSGWRRRPPRISSAIVRLAAARIAEHAATHGLRRVDLVLHGGEPLLTPADVLAAHVEAVRTALPDGCELHSTLQTNGTLLTPDVLDTLAAARIRVGVSLDGGLPAHNARRPDHAGRTSWPAAAQGLRLLTARPETYAGILCVVDPDQDPLETYESLLALRPPALDLLLPHANWSAPPPGAAPGTTPYADWLIPVFDAWFGAARRLTRIRLFEEILALLLGAPAATEALGLAPVAVAVIETDGTIEQVDSLKSAYEGASETGLTLREHTFDQALDHPGFTARQLGPAALADCCRACDLRDICGGGLYPHRYRAGHGFRQPSVHCADLDSLIRHIAGRASELIRPTAVPAAR
ncbi:FxsB family radical SAM/SPASM domain protein [Streptomyces sp. NBC_01537]|uniref:FxsB family cyclophane-forming radical SAM/SPASM peptide maturase n=1 Tax=Streptomyces sp. NBC_01537 TaxID=2903896 RepID=UPI003867B2BF